MLLIFIAQSSRFGCSKTTFEICSHLASKIRLNCDKIHGQPTTIHLMKPTQQVATTCNFLITNLKHQIFVKK
jgi:hypothetical protein